MRNHSLSFLVFSGALGVLEPEVLAQERTQAEHAVQSVAKVAADEAGCKNHRCGASLGAQFDHADLVFDGIVSRVESRLVASSAAGPVLQYALAFRVAWWLVVAAGLAGVGGQVEDLAAPHGWQSSRSGTGRLEALALPHKLPGGHD